MRKTFVTIITAVMFMSVATPAFAGFSAPRPMPVRPAMPVRPSSPVRIAPKPSGIKPASPKPSAPKATPAPAPKFKSLVKPATAAPYRYAPLSASDRAFWSSPTNPLSPMNWLSPYCPWGPFYIFRVHDEDGVERSVEPTEVTTFRELLGSN